MFSLLGYQCQRGGLRILGQASLCTAWLFQGRNMRTVASAMTIRLLAGKCDSYSCRLERVEEGLEPQDMVNVPAQKPGFSGPPAWLGKANPVFGTQMVGSAGLLAQRSEKSQQNRR